MATIIDFMERARELREGKFTQKRQSHLCNRTEDDERLRLISEAEAFYHRILINQHPDVFRAIRLNGGYLGVGVCEPYRTGSPYDSREEYCLIRGLLGRTFHFGIGVQGDYTNRRIIAKSYVEHGTVFDKRDHKVGYHEAFERRIQEAL